MIQKKVIAIILYIALFISIAQPALAQESDEKEGKRQSPVQVITTIVITAGVMKGLSYLKIP